MDMNREFVKGAQSLSFSRLRVLRAFTVIKNLRYFMVTAIIGLTVLFLGSILPVSAAPRAQEATQTPEQRSPLPTLPLSIGNDTCLSCHGQPGLTMKLEDGSILDLSINPQEYDNSIHGKSHYACVQCHTTVGDYPHPAFTAADRRDASLKLYPACYRCHSGEYERTQDSVHATALAAGKREAAICTDCHTAHTVRQLNDPKTHRLLTDARVWIPQTCAQCHNAIYQKYLTSVHGSALVGEGNPDVPTCIDCHGVHNITNPTVTAFRLRSPEMCARCHTDPKRMGKYNISTQVLNTYVADFHGTTVELFEKESPDAQTNKPVCYDCHGIHDIQRVDDPQKGLQIRENLLKRCQVCHPNAPANFPTAWLSHYIPSPKEHSLVYYVGLFYKIFIPSLLGGMAILVVMDFSRMMMNRFRKTRPIPVATPTAAPAPIVEVVPPEVSAPTEEVAQVEVTGPPEVLPSAVETSEEVVPPPAESEPSEIPPGTPQVPEASNVQETPLPDISATSPDISNVNRQSTASDQPPTDNLQGEEAPHD
jgi:hypothetical protein